MEQGSAKSRKRKNKSWFQGGGKKRKFALCADIRGFLLFCNKNEREAIREGYNLLNEYADKDGDAGREEDDPEADIDDKLRKETSELKKASELDESERRFQVVESGVQNVLFVRTTVPEPVDLVMKILRDLESTRVQKTRHLIRMIPVQMTCKAFEPQIRTTLTKLVEKLVASRRNGEEGGGKQEISYLVMFKSRCNLNLFKPDVLKVVQEVTAAASKESDDQVTFAVEYKTPDVCFVFEVMKANCCIGILPRYFHYKKYNLIQVAQNAESGKDQGEGEAATKSEGPTATSSAGPEGDADSSPKK